ncbi:MAG: hypothetical protein Ct9H300mP23_10240 [Nitrospinota bacterium]|nr:MAG: hypothetical protein Ct9H300mP23_10240 [Nitrospinota bacterium]
MFRGNKKYPNSIALNVEFENIGRDLRASTLGEYTQYGFSPHVSKLEKGWNYFRNFFLLLLFLGLNWSEELFLKNILKNSMKKESTLI